MLRLQKNGGIVCALNFGLKEILARGFEYVARLDAADLNRQGRFQRQYERMQADPNLHMLGSNAVFRNEANDEELFVTNLPTSYERARRWMVFRNCFIHPTVMIRTSCLKEIGLYDGGFPHIEDYELFWRIIEKFRAENIDEPLVDCYVREGGISVRHLRQQMLSGLRFRWRHPRLLDPLWYAYIGKRIAYLVVPFQLRNGLKGMLGFVRRPTPTSS